MMNVSTSAALRNYSSIQHPMLMYYSTNIIYKSRYGLLRGINATIFNCHRYLPNFTNSTYSYTYHELYHLLYVVEQIDFYISKSVVHFVPINAKWALISHFDVHSNGSCKAFITSEYDLYNFYMSVLDFIHKSMKS